MNDITKKLFNEVKANHISSVKKILRENKNKINLDVKNSWGDTALIVASYRRYYSCIKALLEAGADPNIRDSFGYTALIWASIKGREKCVELLLKGGADPSIKDKQGRTALIGASSYNEEKCVKLLLEGGADPNIKDNYGQTALDLTTNENIKKMLKRAMAFKQLLPFFIKKKLPKSLHLNTELLRLTTEYLFSRKRSKKRSKKNIH